ncbi:hypothetical protein [Oceanobacter mangrovi]|uniref:hypothetical protein n=1 Tax=Oceanobacter mangrovi TaxID=2862510 RepID=UPI001C8DE592|nr:hypothetical protein [Oceanobacter mangrovi]
MNSKLPLHGPGVYLFTFRGARKQPLFRSVFELEAGVRLLAELPGSRLIAWLLEPTQIRCILRCQEDWPMVIEALQQAFSQQHRQRWGTEHPVLSEQVDVLAIDEPAFLMNAVLQLHRTPVYEGLVPTAELYRWSSDSYYRMPQPPAWLDYEAVWNRLAHSRHRRDQHYINVMEQLPPPELDLVNGNQNSHLALARKRWMASHQPLQVVASENRHDGDLEQDWLNIKSLISRRFGCHEDEFSDPQNRRLYYRLMPLAVWLMDKSGYSLEQLGQYLRIEQTDLQHWIKRVKADHPAQLLGKLQLAVQQLNTPQAEVHPEPEPQRLTLVQAANARSE